MNLTTDITPELGGAVADVRRVPLRRLALAVAATQEPGGSSPVRDSRRGAVSVFQSSI